jgi:WD40 repeat protein
MNNTFKHLHKLQFCTNSKSMQLLNFVAHFVLFFPPSMSAEWYMLQKGDIGVSVAFSPNARDDEMDQPLLAVGLSNGEIALWTQAALRKGEGCSHKLQGHQTCVKSLAFNRRSRVQQQLLASGSVDGTVRLWEMRTRVCVTVMEGHRVIHSVVFSPGGGLLAFASADGTVQLWIVEGRQPECAHILQNHMGNVFSVSFSPDARQLASGSQDRTVRLWSLPEGAPGPVLQHASPVYCVAFSPVVGSNMLASGCGDRIVRLWDVSKQQLLHELQGHSGFVDSIAFAPDGSQLVSGSFDCTMLLWNVASGKLLKVLTGRSTCVAFHPNGKQVASCSCKDIVRIWTVREQEECYRTHPLFGPEMKILPHVH